jgi:type II secretory pathway pseudopilin PulG
MKYGNFLLVIAILMMIVLSSFKYRTYRELIGAVLNQLRVYKSYSARYNFSHIYGPDFRAETNKQIVQPTTVANISGPIEIQTHGDNGIGINNHLLIYAVF